MRSARLLRYGLSAMLAMAVTQPAVAQVPHLIRYQGQAVDSQEVPLEGPYTLTFRLYDAETAGAVVWEETQTDVPVSDGHFTVLLGEDPANPLASLDWSEPRWLSVQINGEPELTPRQRITSVPLAIRAETADAVATSNLLDDSRSLVPVGAILLWKGPACPAGYTRLAEYDNKVLRGSPSPGAEGGSDSTSVTLTTSHLPPHTHTTPPHSHTIDAKPGDGQGAGTINSEEGTNVNTATTRTDGAGISGSTGSGNPFVVETLPAYRSIMLCQKT